VILHRVGAGSTTGCLRPAASAGRFISGIHSRATTAATRGRHHHPCYDRNACHEQRSECHGGALYRLLATHKRHSIRTRRTRTAFVYAPFFYFVVTRSHTPSD
jgi:hypothetical protein